MPRNLSIDRKIIFGRRVLSAQSFETIHCFLRVGTEPNQEHAVFAMMDDAAEFRKELCAGGGAQARDEDAVLEWVAVAATELEDQAEAFRVGDVVADQGDRARHDGQRVSIGT